jgi:hypothetical protein
LAGLIFSLLGQLQIEHGESGAITLTKRKAVGLLAYLLIESNHAHSREFLLGLLWPDLPTAAAQNNLRVTWAQLQKALGTGASAEQPHLLGDRLALRFNPLSDYELDVPVFAFDRGPPSPSARRPGLPGMCRPVDRGARFDPGRFLDEFSLATLAPTRPSRSVNTSRCR